MRMFVFLLQPYMSTILMFSLPLQTMAPLFLHVMLWGFFFLRHLTFFQFVLIMRSCPPHMYTCNKSTCSNPPLVLAKGLSTGSWNRLVKVETPKVEKTTTLLEHSAFPLLLCFWCQNPLGVSNYDALERMTALGFLSIWASGSVSQ